ncbi:hypothetical protein GHT06_011667 [Daphnia sinensis]|uniref:Exonuclease domain-containing protein n=1 Tax=Daphnia sinensis TaxID=1820382 RepID=A0AAD5PVG4_9CRUS|nr:hypothetical protein GHT06_011667 [Daphnia sinensis]
MFNKNGAEMDQGAPPEKRARLSDEEYEALKARLKARKKILQTYPRFKLIMAGVLASLASPKDTRAPLTIKDVQDLILCAVTGEVRHLNRWFLLFQIERISQTTVLVVENVSLSDLEENEECFSKTLEIFEDGVEMMNPKNDGINLSVALAYSPMSNAVKRNMRQVYKSLKEALDDGHVFSDMDCTEQSNQGMEKSTSSDGNQKENLAENNKGCTKTQLMLSALQLITGRYPFPGQGRSLPYRFTKDKYEPVTDNSPMFAVDCEWCQCVDGSIGLARVAIVNENLQPVYHSYVLPDRPIKNYATKWSGITPDLLRGVQKRLCQIQEEIRNLLPPDAILVGHALAGDLKALQLLHPYIIDSSVIFNMTGSRSMASKLQFLSRLFCNRDIQTSRRKGHDPNEDALSTMELVLLKLKNGLDYGDRTRNSMGGWNGPSREKILAVVSNEIFGTGIRDRPHEKLDLQDAILMKFFTFIQNANKSALLITDPAYEKIYRPKTPLHPRLFSCRGAPVKIVQQPEMEKIVTTLESEPNRNLVFVHTAVAKEEENKGHLKKLDQLIVDLHERMPMRGVMIIIFGGKDKSLENGLCMVNVKKPSRDKIVV